jgi:hypothetical protein
MKSILSFLTNDDLEAPYDRDRYKIAPQEMLNNRSHPPGGGATPLSRGRATETQARLYGNNGGGANQETVEGPPFRAPLPVPMSPIAPRNAGQGASGGAGPPDAIQAGCWLIPQEPTHRLATGAQRQNTLTRSPFDARSQPAALTAPTGGYTGDYNEELWQTEWANAEPVVSTGAILNPYTGEIAETFESAIPPPDRRGGDQAREMKNKQLRLDWANGGQLQKHVRKDLEQPLPAADSGPISEYQTGVQSGRIKLEALHRGERSAYGNRNDELLQLPQMARNPYGYIGLQNMVRTRPIPATTNQLSNGGYVPTHEVVGTTHTLKSKQRLRKEMFYGDAAHRENDEGRHDIVRYGGVHNEAAEEPPSDFVVRKSNTVRHARPTQRPVAASPAAVYGEAMACAGAATARQRVHRAPNQETRGLEGHSKAQVLVATKEAIHSSLGLGAPTRPGTSTAGATAQAPLATAEKETFRHRRSTSEEGTRRPATSDAQVSGSSAPVASTESRAHGGITSQRASASVSPNAYGGGGAGAGQEAARKVELATDTIARASPLAPARAASHIGEESRGGSSGRAGQLVPVQRGVAQTSDIFCQPIASAVSHETSLGQREELQSASRRRLTVDEEGHRSAGAAAHISALSSPRKRERIYGDAMSVARTLTTNFAGSNVASQSSHRPSKQERATQPLPQLGGEVFAAPSHVAQTTSRTGREATSVLSKSLSCFVGPSAHTAFAGEITKVGAVPLLGGGDIRAIHSAGIHLQSADASRSAQEPRKQQLKSAAQNPPTPGFEGAAPLASELTRKPERPIDVTLPAPSGREVAPSTLRTADAPPVWKADKVLHYTGTAEPGSCFAASARGGRHAASLLDNRGLVYVDRQPGYEKMGADVVLPVRAANPQPAKVPTFETPKPRMERQSELLSERAPLGARERTSRDSRLQGAVARERRALMPERAHRQGLHGMSEPLECSSEEDHTED